jgi:hypothetical protein
MILTSLYFGMLFMNWGDVLDYREIDKNSRAAVFTYSAKITAL